MDSLFRVFGGGWPRTLWRLLVVALVLLPTSAGAADRLTDLAAKLRGDKDFRVRTQAALALGVSQSDRAAVLGAR
jgi:hypothetical protein